MSKQITGITGNYLLLATLDKPVNHNSTLFQINPKSSKQKETSTTFLDKINFMEQTHQLFVYSADKRYLHIKSVLIRKERNVTDFMSKQIRK